MPGVQIFLSTVTVEFRSYRDALARHLDRPDLSVKVQEDFIPTGSETLDKLDGYIRQCEAVIHLVGDMSGAFAQPSAVASILERHHDLVSRLPAVGEVLSPGSPPLSYTQWEAYLAVYHRKRLFICVPEPSAPRDPTFRADDAQRENQQAHLQRLNALGRYAEVRFASCDGLTIELLRSTLHEILPPVRRPVSLPYPSLGTLFKGREEFLQRLRAGLERAADGRATAIVGQALHGLGGVGKTRLAVEYAWRYLEVYTALLFISAETPQDLRRNLAALSGPLVLDLPEQDAPDKEARVAATLRWLGEHPGWLLILDNADSLEAAVAAEELLGHLRGGQVLLTSRLTQWSAGVEPMELDVLEIEDAAAFLLERTERSRRKLPADAEDAAALARELDGLALALEQAGAYVAARRRSLTEYLQDWRAHAAEVQEWHDGRLMHYPRSVAVTWQTTMEQLGAGEIALLRLLAWLAPEPLPLWVLESDEAELLWRNAVRLLRHGEKAKSFWQKLGAFLGRRSARLVSTSGRLEDALTRLGTFSMVRWDPQEQSISVHRVVQEILRTRLPTRERPRWLTLSLRLLDHAWPGDPMDVRTWPRWNLLRPHIATAVAEADQMAIAEPTASLIGQLGLLGYARALHGEAEKLMLRNLAVDEPDLGSQASQSGDQT